MYILYIYIYNIVQNYYFNENFAGTKSKYNYLLNLYFIFGIFKSVLIDKTNTLKEVDTK